MTYALVPGTTPYRAVLHLRALGKGRNVSVTSADLAEHLDVETTNLHNYLLNAVKAGLLTYVKGVTGTGKSTRLWSLGDGVPLPKPEDDDEQEYNGGPPLDGHRRFECELRDDGRLRLVIRGAKAVNLMPNEVAQIRETLRARADDWVRA